jgi:hypothetical protein
LVTSIHSCLVEIFFTAVMIITTPHYGLLFCLAWNWNENYCLFCWL